MRHCERVDFMVCVMPFSRAQGTLQGLKQGWGDGISQKYLAAGLGRGKVKAGKETKKYESKVLVIHLHEKSFDFFIETLNLWAKLKLCVCMPSVMSNKSFCKLPKWRISPVQLGFQAQFGLVFCYLTEAFLRGFLSLLPPCSDVCRKN